MDLDFVRSLLPDSAMDWVNVVGLGVACSSGLAAAVSKLTKNKTDDKVADWLRKAHDLLAKVGLHGATLHDKRSAARVVDHRNGK